MYTFNNLKEVHIEITTNCQAKCPMCARTRDGENLNPLLTVTNLDIEKIQQALTPELLNQIDRVMFCGNFGDPILHPNLIDIIQYIVQINPNIFLDIHTNGSARNVSWWRQLARSMPKNHLVTFGIDGLYDTHSLYRIGTNFDTIIKNAKMFINNGGNACWTFIIFKHNEHQVELAEQLAKTTGFKTFQAKQTSRFLINPYLDVVNKKGKTTHRLEFPTESKLTFIDKKTLTNFQSLTSSVEVSCQVEQTNSVYIDVYGQVWPCCFIASTPYQYTELDSPTLGFVNASKQSLNEVVNKLGGIEKLNIKTQSIKDIVNSEKWQTVWDDGFKGPNKLHMCARTCGNFSTV